MVYFVPLLVSSQKAIRQSHSSTISLFLTNGAPLPYLSYSGRNSISFRLPLSKYTLGIFVNLYSSTASMSKQFATIFTTPYTSKKVEFIDNYVFAFLAIFLVLVYIRSYAFYFVKVQTFFLNKEVLTLYNF